jgi:uncharacterized membrane protein YqgA involved in biofilm formation
VLAGGGIGITAGGRIPARVTEGLISTLGLFTVAYGLRTVLSPAFSGAAAPDWTLRVADMLPALLVAPLIELAVRSWSIPI